jgi:putative glycosyltransferase (TIGR04372 family)
MIKLLNASLDYYRRIDRSVFNCLNPRRVKWGVFRYVTGVLRFGAFFAIGSFFSLILGPFSLVYPIQVWLMPLGPDKASHFIEALEVHLRRRHIENKKVFWTLVIWPQKFPNDALAKLYKREVFIIGPKQKLIARVLPFIIWRASVTNHAADKVSIEISRLKSLERPIIPFTSNELEFGECLEQELFGVNHDDFLLLGYPSIKYRDITDQKYHPNDDLITQLPEPQNFVSVIKNLSLNNITVVRQGLMLNESPELFAAGLVVPDYAKYPSGFVDVWLAYKCKFLLSACSGSWWFGLPFNKSAVITDIYSPIGMFVAPASHTIIFQLPLNIASNKLESFEWMMKNRRWCFDSKKIGTEYLIVKNTPGQIVDVVTEHLARLNGTWLETEEDKMLQQKFRHLVLGGSADDTVLPRVGAKFLREHQHLLPD